MPRCHVKRLVTVQDGASVRVTDVETNQGNIPVPQNGIVVIALGTIESTRLALNSFQGTPTYNEIGEKSDGPPAIECCHSHPPGRPCRTTVSFRKSCKPLLFSSRDDTPLMAKAATSTCKSLRRPGTAGRRLRGGTVPEGPGYRRLRALPRSRRQERGHHHSRHR